MKRIGIGLLLAALAVLWLALPGFAGDDIYFTAINNTLLDLEADSMPIKHKSMLCLPYSRFSSNDLGIYSVYSRSKQLVLVSNGEKSLYFDMSAGNSYDDQGETYPYAAVHHNDTAYLPAYFTASFFGIRYSYIRSESGHIIRISKGEILSDADFVSGAASMMESRLAAYLRAQEPEVTPSPPPTASPSPPPSPPPTPTVRPTPTWQPTAPPLPPVVDDRSGVTVYLAVMGLSEQTPALLDTLSAHGSSACFFVSPDEISAQPDLIRRILGSGFGVGFRLSGDWVGEQKRAAALLREAARAVCFLSAAETALSAEELAAAEESGLRLWSAEETLHGSAICPVLLAAAERRCDLLLRPDFRPEDLDELLTLLAKEHYKQMPITELVETRLCYAETLSNE